MTDSNSIPAMIQECHKVFCAETGTEPNMAIHQRAYADFISKGYTPDDLRLVIWFLKRENKRMNGAKFSMRLDKLLDFDYRHFDGLLCEAKPVWRNTKPVSAKTQVLQQFRRTSEPDGGPAPRIVKDVMKGMG